MFIEYNPNPKAKRVDDCVIRAITKIMDIDWDTAFLGVVSVAYAEKNMPSINDIWGKYLLSKGFTKHIIPNTCPHCYTVRDFTEEHQYGKYILATGSHTIAAENIRHKRRTMQVR